MAKDKRPTPKRVLDVRARVVRGPREDGAWYWRVWRTVDGAAAALGAGWWREEEVEPQLYALIREQPQILSGDPLRPRVDTVGELLAYWMGDVEDRADLAPRTVKLRREAARHVNAILGTTLVRNVDRGVLDRYRDRRLREPVTLLHTRRLPDGSPVTHVVDGKVRPVRDPVPTGRTTAPRSVLLELQVLSMAWRWARTSGLVDTELPRVTVRVRGHVANRYTPTPAEIALVMQHLEGWSRLALLLYAGTGARLDEIASLTWSRVDLTAGTLRVRGKMGERLVPIQPPLVAALLEAGPGEPDARVLSCTHNTARALYQRLDKACAAAGVHRLNAGALRRAVVDALYRQGDPSVAARIAGHSVRTAMQHYRDVTEEEMRAAMAGARLGHLADPNAKVVALPVARPK